MLKMRVNSAWGRRRLAHLLRLSGSRPQNTLQTLCGGGLTARWQRCADAVWPRL